MKKFVLFSVIIALHFISLAFLWSQEASWKNTTDYADEASAILENPSSEKPSTTLDSEASCLTYQTAPLSPSSLNTSSSEHSSFEALKPGKLPPTKYPIERKLSKGFSTYCGVVFGTFMGFNGGLLAWECKLSLTLIAGTTIVAGAIAGILFTYGCWKLLNYYFES